MDDERRAALGRIMGALRSAEAAVIELYQEFHEEIGQVVGFLARRRLPSISPDDLEALVFDACLALARVAPSWRSDAGALPWVWARGRIVALVEAALPLRSCALPDEEDLPASPPTLGSACPDDPDVGMVLARLAERDHRVALLAVAMHESVGLRDGGIWLRYRIQQQAGDPSPANTVADELGLRPPTVRQRASRARRRLARHVSSDPRFAPLADLPLLAGAA
jgi:DNA-directed RNA polymerase specialized sigma24 family protein